MTGKRGFVVKDNSIDKAVEKIQDSFKNLGIENCSKTDVIRYLLKTKNSNTIKKQVKRNNQKWH